MLLVAGLSFFGGTRFRAAEAKAQAKPAAKKTATLWAAGEIKWTDVPDVKGAQQAALWGNPNKGAYGAFNKFPRGTEIPLHTHTYDLRGVIVSGTAVIGLEGQSPKELGPGSYYFLPGGAKHTTTCKAGADCLFFSEQPGAFDVKPVAAAGAKK